MPSALPASSMTLLRLLFAFLLSCVIGLPAMAALGEGDVAPDFEAEASVDGKVFNFSLREALKEGPVVVYFFPAAFTSGCNIQAHEFAVSHHLFVAAGATVVGVSLDGIARLKDFSADPDYCGGKVAVASDVNGRIAKLYDLRVLPAPAGAKDTRGIPIEHGLVESVTFVVKPDGKIAATVTDPSPSSHVAKALAAVQKLAPKQMAMKKRSGIPDYPDPGEASRSQDLHK